MPSGERYPACHVLNPSPATAKRALVAFQPGGSCGWEIGHEVSCRTCLATEVTSTAGWLISRTRGTMANHTSPAAMITTIEMTMLRRLPKPCRAGGCTAGAGAVSGTVSYTHLTLPTILRV